jgi:hypothetical protein
MTFWLSHVAPFILEKTECVIKILCDIGLRVIADKSTFCADKIDYHWYWVSQLGIQPIPKKVEAIKNMVRPTRCQELRRFIGMIN